MNPQQIRAGIVGANPGRGWALAAHIPALHLLPEYELSAVSTTRAVSAREASQQFNTAYGFDNFTELVTHPEVDLVIVAVKAPDHYPIVMKALEAGKHIYCEWPLGNGMAEVEKMAALARNSRKIHAIGLQGRYSPAINQLRELVRSGAIGKVLSTSMIGAGGEVFGETIAAPFAFMLDKSQGATLLSVQFGHYADCMCYVLGEFTSVNSTMAIVRNEVRVIETNEIKSTNTPDQIVVSGLLNDEIVAAVHVRGGQPDAINFLWEIHGTAGDLLITIPAGYLHMMDFSIRMTTRGNADSQVITAAPSFRKVQTENSNVPAYSIAHLYRAIAGNIQSGQQTVASFDDALKRHRLVAAVELAALTGVRQSLI